jgi:hypothetical protein
MQFANEHMNPAQPDISPPPDPIIPPPPGPDVPPLPDVDAPPLPDEIPGIKPPIERPPFDPSFPDEPGKKPMIAQNTAAFSVRHCLNQ